MRSSNIVKVFYRKKGEETWKDATAPVWFRRGKEAFMKKINKEDLVVVPSNMSDEDVADLISAKNRGISEEDWFLGEKKGV